MELLQKQSEMFRELLASCNNELAINEDNAYIRQLRGLVYNAGEMYDEAITDLNKVIEQRPESKDAFYLRSDCHFMKCDFNLAKQDYLRALKLDNVEGEKVLQNYTEDLINESTVATEELSRIKKILEWEKTRILLNYMGKKED